MNGSRHRLAERLFLALCLVAICLPLALLGTLIVDVVIDSAERLSWDFLTSLPSRRATRAGILVPMVGTAWLMVLTSVIALPIGIGAAVYLEEYGRHSRVARVIETNIANLAGVPSVIYGLLGLTIFVRAIGFGRSLLAGACTLALLILPIVIMASREALRTVPREIREGGAMLGATRWQTVWQLVIPMALPGILTGAILSVSRAIGETAPLVVVGAVTYITALPKGPMSEFTALPIQIFNWVSRPQEAFAYNAAAGIVVLLAILLVMNGFAIVLRNRLQKRY